MRQRIRKGMILFTFLMLPAIFYYFSPYLIIMGASEGIVSGSFIVFAVLFLSALFLGRGFCAWFCPLAGIQEACFFARNKKVSNKYNWIRYIIWIPWIAIIIYMAVAAGGFIRVDFFYQTTYGFSISDVYGLFMYLIVVLFTIILSAKGFKFRIFKLLKLQEFIPDLLLQLNILPITPNRPQIGTLSQ